MTCETSLPASLHQWLSAAWQAAHGCPLPERGWSACPRPDLADLTHAGALLASRQLGKPPRALAQAWREALPAHPAVAEVTLAGPGHLNLRLAPEAWQVWLSQPAARFERAAPPPPTLVEFVSANPTGPLHLGHARQAVLGDVIARLLRTLGGRVGTEFFYNDAGNQIDMLEQSLDLRVQEQQGALLLFERDGATQANAQAQGALLFPAAGYHGQYVVDLAQAWLASPPAQAHGMRAYAIAAIQAEQQADLAHLGVVFDGQVSERSLFERGAVARVLDALKPHAYQALAPRQQSEPPAPDAQPAWFLETTRWGDDKDRVMLKADGSTTYFVPDVAYHLDKWQRGWVRAINLQGSDHHGTLARVRAGVQAVEPAIGADYPQVIFHTMIKVIKGGQPVKASKRAGDYLTAREVADCVGVDTFRMAMLDKKPESPVVLDIDQWLARSTSNPVYSLQYAHARLCAALDKAQSAPPGPLELAPWDPSERALWVALLLWPQRLQSCALDTDPVRLATQARELASSVHEAYQKGPRLLELDAASRAPRLALYQATVQALRQACALLGVSCPQRMDHT